jgi:hypothetical protein
MKGKEKMKKHLILATILFFVSVSAAMYAQDVVITKKGNIIEAKILEIGSEEVKYKEFNSLNGPDRFMKKSEIASIIYSNGQMFIFEKETPQYSTEKAPQYSKTEKVENKKKQFNPATLNPAAYNTHQTGKKLRIAGIALMATGGTLFTIGSAYIEIDGTPLLFDIGGSIAFICSGASCLAAGVTLYLIGKRKQQTSLMSLGHHISLGLSSNGLGLCLNF